MKKIIAFALMLGLTACQKKEKTFFSDDALHEKLQTTGGEETTFKDVLEQYKGSTIVIDVWASWCPDCIKGMPKLKELQKNYPEVLYLFLSYDKSLESWKDGIAKYDVTGEHYRILSDWKGGGFKKAADIDWIPRYIVVKPDGEIALYRAIEADDEKLLNTLKTLL